MKIIATKLNRFEVLAILFDKSISAFDVYIVQIAGETLVLMNNQHIYYTLSQTGKFSEKNISDSEKAFLKNAPKECLGNKNLNIF